MWIDPYQKTRHHAFVQAFQIIGVLNVTPDSFYDGGRFGSVAAAVERVKEMIDQGADIIEVGGESTGPKSVDVSMEEERKRVIPVIKKIHEQFSSVKISVDTWKSEIAREAIGAGATMVNDVTAGRGDSGMFAAIAEADIPIVLMFSKDATPRTTIADVQYDDVIKTIQEFLMHRKQAALDSGIKASNIILDPGLGHFISSDPKFSFEILSRLSEFQKLGCPILVSPSRKSFLAGPEQLKTIDRLQGTIAASGVAVLNGAIYIRTHDVLEVRRGCEIAGKVLSIKY